MALPPSPAVIHSASSRSRQLAPSPLSSDSPCASCPKLSKPFAGDPAGALALVGSLSTGAATREASLDLDLGAVEKELSTASPPDNATASPPDVAAAESPKKAGTAEVERVFTEMDEMIQTQREATEELYKLAEDNDKKGLAYAPQNFTEEQSKEVGKIEDEMDQENGRVTTAMFRAEQDALKVAKKSNFTRKDPEAVEEATADAQTEMKEEDREIKNIQNIPGGASALGLMG